MKNPTIVAGYGRVGGHLVALVANNGNLDKDAAKKVMSPELQTSHQNLTSQN